MKIRLLTLLFLIGTGRSVFPQLPQDVYNKPLKEVLADIEKRYKIKLEYSENDIKGVDVMYPTWRYRVDLEQTLTNILYPADFIFLKKNETVYQVSRYEYWHKTPAEGKQHLDQLLAIYSSLSAWESRKTELRKCFLEQLRLSPLPRKTALNPIYTSVRKFDGYTIENVAI